MYITDFESLVSADFKFFQASHKKAFLIINDFGMVMEDEVKKVCADNQIAEWMRVWIPYNDEPGGVEVS